MSFKTNDDDNQDHDQATTNLSHDDTTMFQFATTTTDHGSTLMEHVPHQPFENGHDEFPYHFSNSESLQRIRQEQPKKKTSSSSSLALTTIHQDEATVLKMTTVNNQLRTNDKVLRLLPLLKRCAIQNFLECPTYANFRRQNYCPRPKRLKKLRWELWRRCLKLRSQLLTQLPTILPTQLGTTALHQLRRVLPHGVVGKIVNSFIFPQHIDAEAWQRKFRQHLYDDNINQLVNQKASEEQVPIWVYRIWLPIQDMVARTPREAVLLAIVRKNGQAQAQAQAQALPNYAGYGGSAWAWPNTNCGCQKCQANKAKWQRHGKPRWERDVERIMERIAKRPSVDKETLICVSCLQERYKNTQPPTWELRRLYEHAYKYLEVKEQKLQERREYNATVTQNLKQQQRKKTFWQQRQKKQRKSTRGRGKQ